MGSFAEFLKASDAARSGVRFENEQVQIDRTSNWAAEGILTWYRHDLPLGYFVIDGDAVLSSRMTWKVIRDEVLPRYGDGLRFVYVVFSDADRAALQSRDALGDLEAAIAVTGEFVVDGLEDFKFIQEDRLAPAVKRTRRQLEKLEGRLRAVA